MTSQPHQPTSIFTTTSHQQTTMHQTSTQLQLRRKRTHLHLLQRQPTSQPTSNQLTSRQRATKLLHNLATRQTMQATVMNNHQLTQVQHQLLPHNINNQLHCHTTTTTENSTCQQSDKLTERFSNLIILITE